MMMAAMRTHTAIALGELDAFALDPVDGSDMRAIGADHFHMFSYLTGIHVRLASIKRIGFRNNAWQDHRFRKVDSGVVIAPVFA
jgi:hypothetical protein